MSQNIVVCLQFRKRAPSLASAAEATTNCNMAHRVKKAPFNLMGLVGSACQTHEKMSTGSAVGVCFGKIQHVQMNVEDHVGCMKTDCCIGVCCQVVKQLLPFGHRLLRSLCLFACNHTECHEHCEVKSAGVIQGASNDMLDVLDVGVAEGGRCLRREGTLGFTAKLLGLGSIRTMLRPGRGGMPVFLQLFDDVTRHRNVEGAHVVISLEVDAAVEITVPILCEFIYLLYAPDEVVNVFLMRIFYPEIIHNKREGDLARYMHPEAGSVRALIISMGGKAFLEELVG
jgi:hypothetical protein